MRSATKAVISVAVVLVMTAACICITPSSDSEMKFQDGKHYGSADSVSYDTFDNVIQTLSGKTIKQWIEQFFADNIADYDLDNLDVNLNASLTARRDITINDDICTIDDYWSGFMETYLLLDISGKYPNAGTYYANENEELLDFMARIFGSYGNEQRSTELHTDLNLYLDLHLTTDVEVSTGLVKDADLEVKLLIKDYEHNTIQIVVDTDEDGYPESMTVTYEEHNVNNMFYIDLEVELTPQKMRVTSNEAKWRIEPVVKEHVHKSIISSDLADSLWLTLLASSGDESEGGSKLPELILEILGSGGRILDLFDTIKSLTSSEIPDVEFSMVFDANYLPEYVDEYCDKSGRHIDAHTNEYCKMVVPDKTTGDPDPTKPPLYFPAGGYSLDLAQYVQYIPDSIMDADERDAAWYILVALGLGYDDNDPHIFKPVELVDLSGHDDLRMQSDLIRSYVDQNISSVEKESYDIPDVFQFIAWGGIALTVVVIVLMWRRYI